jgi:hypothetical protein
VRDEYVQLICYAAATLMQVYVTEPWKFTAFARMWDVIARYCAWLANMLGWASMKARENYYTALAAMEH